MLRIPKLLFLVTSRSRKSTIVDAIRSQAKNRLLSSSKPSGNINADVQFNIHICNNACSGKDLEATFKNTTHMRLKKMIVQGGFAYKG